ncbi:hypothetical protein CEUSTIGMA_g5877.t1 [Chlamydomonas eustigma]|uniref:Uncharacterized protein n=1 Tax=Chlamydomonas eustigma TaxID=1157962 RepID=A0A250X5X1_9CHLO|nr:hypothetical protein CEUSTIGMA_g5877.t1 [Chlamydomonas eustigma]|eukprot:GAX78436.1 hypothetical protein CEUSTIGMA_g5877.t1 [Chlamydomonas eustigma]
MNRIRSGICVLLTIIAYAAISATCQIEVPSGVQAFINSDKPEKLQRLLQVSGNRPLLSSGARNKQFTLGDSTSSSQLLPTGLRKTLTTASLPMPEALASMLHPYRDIASALTNKQGQFSAAASAVIEGPPNSSQIISNVAQATIDAAVLGVVSSALNTAGGIFFTISGALATLEAGPSIAVAKFALITAPVSYTLSEYAFGQTLYNDFNSQVDGSDYIGLAIKYLQLWNQFKTELGSSSADTSSMLTSQLKQLEMAKAMIQAAITRTIGGSAST